MHALSEYSTHLTYPPPTRTKEEEVKNEKYTQSTQHNTPFPH
jgi:hypothetical protein